MKYEYHNGRCKRCKRFDASANQANRTGYCDMIRTTVLENDWCELFTFSFKKLFRWL